MKTNPFELKRVAIRLVEEPPLYSKEPLSSPKAVVKAVMEEIRSYDREVIALINMQQDCRPINMTIASMGQIESALANPRELLKAAILSNATGIIMLHNHPSGRAEPSEQDIALTDKMNIVSNLIGIQFLDHIIVGRNEEFYSFKERAKLPYRTISLTKDAKEISFDRKENRESVLERLQKTYDRDCFKSGNNRGPER